MCHAREASAWYGLSEQSLGLGHDVVDGEAKLLHQQRAGSGSAEAVD